MVFQRNSEMFELSIKNTILNSFNTFVLLATVAILACLTGEIATDNSSPAENNTNLILTPQAYSKLLAARRKEHEYVVQHMLKSNYEKSYKMINFAYAKIFEVIKKNNQTLVESHYDPQHDGFPKTNEQQQEAVTLIIENSCLFSSIFLHFPEISYRILKNRTFSTWKDVLNWSIDFVDKFPHIIDESTVKLIELVRLQIHNEKSHLHQEESADSDKIKVKEFKKKIKKKLKKGPQLTRGQNKDEL